MIILSSDSFVLFGGALMIVAYYVLAKFVMSLDKGDDYGNVKGNNKKETK